MNRKRKGGLRLVLAALISVFGCVLPAKASAAETISMGFDVYVSHTRVFRFGYNTTLKPDTYRVSFELKPTKLARLLVKLKMGMNAEGRLNKLKASPESFVFYTRKNKQKIYEVEWRGGEKPKTRRTPAIPDDKARSISSALQPELPDPLTAMLRAGLQGAWSPCTGTQRVYNGNEVFDLKFEMLESQEFGPGDNSLYRGPALKCSVTYVPVAGLPQHKMAAHESNPQVFNVWFAPVRSRTLKRTLLIPIGASGTVSGKSFLAHASAASIDGRPFNADSLVSR